MVCEKLAQDDEFRRLPQEKREILFVAALMHDFGKIPCTVMEGTTWKSPNHTIVGSKMAYLSGRNVWKDQDIFDDTWGEVIMMSGLPGTGKDTWIKANYSDIPMISLDDIRIEKHISPTDNQGGGDTGGKKPGKDIFAQTAAFCVERYQSFINDQKKAADAL